MAEPAPAPASPAPSPPRPVPRFSVGYMDRSVPAATDFYRYATGAWVRENPVPADQSRWGAFQELTERNFALIRTLLEESADPAGTDRRPVRRQVGDFFASAMDVTRLNALGLAPLAADLEAIDSVGSLEELLQVVGRFHQQGVGGLFAPFIYADQKESGVYAFYLFQGGLALPDREYYLSETFAAKAAAYRQHVAHAFQALGASPPEAARSADLVFAIERALAEASRPRAELRDAEKNYHRVTVADLSAQTPHLPWGAYLAAWDLGRLDHLVVGQPEFLSGLDGLLRDRPLAEWKTYLRWHLWHASAPFLDETSEREDFDFFHRILVGQEQPEPRWRRAARVLDEEVGEAVGELYVERHFPPEARARVTELVDDLREVFRDRLGHLGWMTEETRRRAIEKFDRFSAKIGHPVRFRDYGSIRIDRGDYLGNVRRAEEFESRRQAVRVGGPVDRSEWDMTPSQVNAYFRPTQNEIVFPAGILQPPFFDVEMDDAVNYGGIGAVIGHEITHGYDDQGRKYDADGNLADWWTTADAEEFGRRAAEVVEEYGRYEALPGGPVNGQLTLGENIADIGGVSLAFEALQRRLRADPARRRTVDGLTPEQRFFISWAQVWRQTIRDDEQRRRLTVDPHSPGRFRAIGGATNQSAFFEAFGIREGAPMWRARDRRISIW